MAEVDANYLAVIAIDFGTTFTGYAFSLKSNQSDIKMNKNWTTTGVQSYKTPTTVLLEPAGELHAFGYEAEDEIQNHLDPEEIEQGYLLFQRFKMELYKHKDLSSDIHIASTTQVDWPALDIFAKSLRYIKDHCLAAMNQTLARAMDEEYIRWVITVPAIWSDTAKKFMRLAATEAGLVDDMLSERLVIALEPEAASMYCRTLVTDEFVSAGADRAGLRGQVTMDPGERYIIVDCGGGTIDTTVHEVLRDGRVCEVAPPCGGPWGGTVVDSAYYQLLDTVFGANFMSTLQSDHPATWLTMRLSFEQNKKAARMGKGINIGIPMALSEVFTQETRQRVEDCINENRNLGVRYSNGNMRISADAVRDLHAEPLGQIRDHINSLLDSSPDLQGSKLFIVGGFGESVYIQDFFRSEFGDRVQILIPNDAGICVMKGAVLFGHDAQAIRSRISRFNYGLNLNRKFKPGSDAPDRARLPGHPDRVFALKRLINRGDVLQADDIINYTAKTLRGAPSFEIELCATENDDSDDPFADDVIHLERLVITTPSDATSQDRDVRITLRFGGTDILLSAEDVQFGNEVNARIAI